MQFNTRIDKITDPLLSSSGVALYVKRDDLIHPYVSGNKLYKLKYNVEDAIAQGHDTILTFGGAWSNHLVATAAYCKAKGLHSIGIVRGEELGGKLNAALSFCIQQGMLLHFVSRGEYSIKTEAAFIETLKTKFGNFYLVPEGGANALGVKGAAEMVTPSLILPQKGEENLLVCCACGTGTTLAGIASSLKGETKAIGFSVLKGEDALSAEVANYVGHHTNWNINTDYHFGGYAKTTPELLAFKERFEQANHIPLDKVYTAKLFYGLYNLINQGYFSPGTKILSIHTGGYSFE